MAGLRQVHLVPGPAPAAFFGVPHIGVIRGDQAGSGRREALLVPPPDHLLPARACLQAELLDPDPAQRLHRGQLPQPARRARIVDLPQQVVAVPAVPHGQVRALSLTVRQPEVIDPLPAGPPARTRRSPGPASPARRPPAPPAPPGPSPRPAPAGSGPGSGPGPELAHVRGLSGGAPR